MNMDTYKAEVTETTETKYTVFDYMYRNDFGTLKEAREDYKLAKDQYGMAALIKTTKRITTIESVKVMQSC